MTSYQRRALALILQVAKYEISKPSGRITNQYRRVMTNNDKTLLATFNVREISFTRIDLLETTNNFQFFSESMAEGNIRLKSDREPSDERYNRTVAISTSLTEGYVTGWDENRSYFTAWVESPHVVKIEDDTARGHRVYAYYVE